MKPIVHELLKDIYVNIIGGTILPIEPMNVGFIFIINLWIILIVVGFCFSCPHDILKIV
ncbi:hypothetical protein [Natronincola ferrireducens]|uniref:hypothetical protein n=1 Tax=Natronincola ferrireducens TaxID=393762 RepID=UPI0015A16AA9|nr:hypothetical protein [Natronincola ferrireducens]